MITLVAAIDKNNVLGKENTMPWHLPADLVRFKKLTTGHPIIMGRKTYDSIGKPLPERTNIVLTRADIEIEGCVVVHSIEEAVEKAKQESEQIFVIGGAQIFALTLPLADRLDLAFVDTEVEGADVFFPEYDLAQWKEIYKDTHKADEKNEFDIEWVIYERK